jgi:hypothetical protein
MENVACTEGNNKGIQNLCKAVPAEGTTLKPYLYNVK